MASAPDYPGNRAEPFPFVRQEDIDAAKEILKKLAGDEVPDLVFVLHAGRSDSVMKCILLPCEGMIVSDKPFNGQDPRWPDTFNVSVHGCECYITRTDRASGWGQRLKLEVKFPDSAVNSASTPALLAYDLETGEEHPITLECRTGGSPQGPSPRPPQGPTIWQCIGTCRWWQCFGACQFA